METRIEFPLGHVAIARTEHITVFGHRLFSGWWHGRLSAADGTCLAYTEQAFPTKLDAIKAIASVLVNNVIHT